MEVLGEAAYRLRHTAAAAGEQDVYLVVVGHAPRAAGETAAIEAAP